jgi:hypothetical protein
VVEREGIFVEDGIIPITWEDSFKRALNILFRSLPTNHPWVLTGCKFSHQLLRRNLTSAIRQNRPRIPHDLAPPLT